MEFRERLLPSSFTNLVKKMVKNPIKSGIVIYLIYKILKPYLKTKEGFSEDLTSAGSDWSGVKMLKWKDDSKNNKGLPKQVSKKAIFLIDAKPVKDSKTGQTNHIFTVFRNKKPITRFTKLGDAKKSMVKMMNKEDFKMNDYKERLNSLHESVLKEATVIKSLSKDQSDAIVVVCTGLKQYEKIAKIINGKSLSRDELFDIAKESLSTLDRLHESVCKEGYDTIINLSKRSVADVKKIKQMLDDEGVGYSILGNKLSFDQDDLAGPFDLKQQAFIKKESLSVCKESKPISGYNIPNHKSVSIKDDNYDKAKLLLRGLYVNTSWDWEVFNFDDVTKMQKAVGILRKNNIKFESLSAESYKEKVLKYKIVDHLNNEYDLHFDTDRAKIIRLSGNQAKKFFDVTNTASLEIGMLDEFEDNGKSGVLKYLNKYLHKPIYNIKKESLSRLDRLHESVMKESETGIWYDDIEKIVDVVGEKTGFKTSDPDFKAVNKILYSVKSFKGERDLRLSNREVNILKKAIKKYNIRGLHSDVLKESLSDYFK